MKEQIKKIGCLMALALSLVLFMSGCVERRYYREHHQHSPEYIHRHHTEIDIHN